MKTTHAFTLAAISLSLTLCACDKGDKKEDGAAPKLPSTKVKSATPDMPAAPDGAGTATTANPQPPEPGEPAQGMSIATAPAMKSPTGEDIDPGLAKLQQAVGSFKMRGAMKGGVTGMPTNPNIKQTATKTTASALTSLDQLVKAGIIKSIPEAPAGKKYVLDPITSKVTLENK